MEMISQYSSKRPLFYPEETENRPRVMRDLICFRDIIDVPISQKALIFLEMTLEAIMEASRLIAIFLFFSFSYFMLKYLDATYSEGISLGIFVSIVIYLIHIPAVTIA